MSLLLTGLVSINTQTESKSCPVETNIFDGIQLPEHYRFIMDKQISTDNDGALFIAYNHNKNNEPVAIKKIPSTNHKKISSLLTTNNSKKNGIFANLFGFFRSETHFYVILDYNFNVTLSEFVLQCREYISQGRLNVKHYCKTMKYLLWRIAKAIHALHSNCKTHSVCNVRMDNIMVRNADFIIDSKNFVSIHPQIDIVYIDVSMLGIVNTSNNLSVNYHESDSYRFGSIIYYCFVGHYPIEQMETWAICNNRLTQYLMMNCLILRPNIHLLSLLNGLLNMNLSKQFGINTVLKHQFFKSLPNQLCKDN